MSDRHDAGRVVVAIRADASLNIGTGHVMRCLTLACALRKAGAECHFLCREHPGNLIEMIEGEGFIVHRLAMAAHDETSHLQAEHGWFEGDQESQPERWNSVPEHSHWLGADWRTDAGACGATLKSLMPDWLIVDHYALNACWEKAALPANTRLMVIDDLADRVHIADILLDQNLGRLEADYDNLVPEDCLRLIGPRYALLRSEFAELREKSLARRRDSLELKRLLISLGGVDKDNVTEAVLDALKTCGLPEGCRITVVMGASAPWLDNVRAKAAELTWSTEVVVNVNNMAERMAEADLAIGAAGSTSWERCCLGVPTLMLELAENQKGIAQALHQVGAAYNVGEPSAVNRLSSMWEEHVHPTTLTEMSLVASRLVDGNGVARLVEWMTADSRPEVIGNG